MPPANNWMIDPNDAVMLLIDHQSGLFQLARDIDQPVFPDAMDFASIMVEYIVPPYRALIESCDKAQSVQKVGHETKLVRAAGTPAAW